VQERIWACAAVSNLINNDPSTRRLLQGKNIVGSLIARLKDDSEEVVVEAAGSLRYEDSLRMREVISLILFPETFALTGVTRYVLRCSTKAFWNP
jgi:hypothetical protein